MTNYKITAVFKDDSEKKYQFNSTNSEMCVTELLCDAFQHFFGINLISSIDKQKKLKGMIFEKNNKPIFVLDLSIKSA